MAIYQIKGLYNFFTYTVVYRKTCKHALVINTFLTL